ncbi:MAG: helix-turn-helix transcriptional regulator [Acidimicrobiales bacterium]
MDVWTSHGDLLRWWRSDIAGLTQQQAAERLNVQPSALSNWERGTRAISLDLEDVDNALKGDRALCGLLWGFGTPDGLEPGRVWTKVFTGPSAPVWMWVRSVSPRIELAAEWGVARMEDTVELGPNGAFIINPVSLPDSPVVIHTDQPVWIDFGWGELPADVPGASVIPAVSRLIPSSADGAFMHMFRTNLAARLQADADDPGGLAGQLPASAMGFARPAGQRGEPPLLWPPAPEGIDAVERARYTRLRTARGLSLPGLSDRLARTTGLEASRDTLRRFETDVGRPHHPMLPVALDHALGAEGRLAVLQIRASRGSGAVHFPPYWRGPVWLALSPAAADIMGGSCQVGLQRGKWQRTVVVDGPESLVSFHWFDPSVPLRIDADHGITWAAGVGRRAGTTPIDQNWAPNSYEVALDAVKTVEQAILAAADRIHPPDVC